jgi:hypothetical protein
MTLFDVIQNLILFTPFFSILIKPVFLGADGGTFVCHEGAIVSKEVHIMFNPNSISSAISVPFLDQQTGCWLGTTAIFFHISNNKPHATNLKLSSNWGNKFWGTQTSMYIQCALSHHQKQHQLLH